LHLNLKLLEDLFPTEFAGKTAPKGYFWKVIADPTRNDEEPGCFYGSLFRLLDILPTVDEVSPWPDGIVFEHVETGQHLTFIDGQPKYLDYPKGGCRERKQRKQMNVCSPPQCIEQSFGSTLLDLVPLSERNN
jgi:hypothetical protein